MHMYMSCHVHVYAHVHVHAHVVAGLSPDVQRTSIEGMGCLTGFRLLNMAQQVAQGTPEAPHH